MRKVPVYNTIVNQNGELEVEGGKTDVIGVTCCIASKCVLTNELGTGLGIRVEI